MQLADHPDRHVIVLLATQKFFVRFLNRKVRRKIGDDRMKGYITRTTGYITRMASYRMRARIISHRTGLYLNGIVGIDGWANFAIELKAYADCRPTEPAADSKQNYVYLLLMGYALENLAKGIIAYKAYSPKITDATPFEENVVKLDFKRKDGKKCKGRGGKEKKCILTTHNLDDLYSARDIGFDVSDTEIDHLRVISIYPLWKGRYPVPLDIDEVPSSEPSFEDLSKTVISIYDRAMAEVERLRSLRSSAK